MQTTTRRGVLAASAALAAAMPGTARAQTRWQAATAYPDGNFQTRNMRAFVDAVQAGSGGRLQIQLHTNASLLRMPEIPYRVVINEAVELAKTYGGTDGYKYVNGVLDRVAARARPHEAPVRG